MQKCKKLDKNRLLYFHKQRIAIMMCDVHIVQVYNYHRLLSWDEERGLHMDIYKVPGLFISTLFTTY